MKYIGKRTSNCVPEKDPYMGSGILITQDESKYGIEYFKKEIIAILNTSEEAFEAERLVIESCNANIDDHFYNIARGGKCPVTNNKWVECITTGIRFDSIKSAQEFYNIRDNSGIQNACKGTIKYCGIDPVTKKKLRWKSVTNFKPNCGAIGIPIAQYSLDGKLIAKFKSSVDAEEKTGISRESISKCLRGINKTGKGFLWRRLDVSGLEQFTSRKKNARKVICLNTEDIFEGTTEAKSYFGLKEHVRVSDVCNGKARTAGKHPDTNEPLRWMYYDEYLETKKVN